MKQNVYKEKYYNFYIIYLFREKDSFETNISNLYNSKQVINMFCAFLLLYKIIVSIVRYKICEKLYTVLFSTVVLNIFETMNHLDNFQ